MSKVFKNNPQQSKLILEELEERRLFSGGIEGLIASDLDSDANAIYREFELKDSQAENTNGEISAAEQQSQEIVFVDAGVDNYQQLVDDIRNNTDSSRNIEVVVLDQDKDGIEEISEFLSHREDLDAIHIISHGSDGSVELGNTSLNAATLEQNNLKIALWANNFADTGDILIYGCNLAGSEAGQSLIDELGALTLTDVAASTDLTGHASMGGDWQLEFSAGTIEASVALSDGMQASYRGALALAADGGNELLNETTTDVQKNADIDLFADGSYVAVWDSLNDGSGEGVYLRILNADGTEKVTETLINQTTLNTQDDPSVAVSSNGDFVVTWTSTQGGSKDVYARLYDSSGTALTNEFLVNTGYTTGEQWNSDVAIDNSGNFVVTWEGEGTGDASGIFARRFDNLGNPLAGEFLVNDTVTATGQIDPAIAMSGSGAFVITWTDQSAGDTRISAQQFSAAGVGQGEFVVHATADSGQGEQESSVAMDDSGNFVVAWAQANADGAGFGIEMQRFDSSGTRLEADDVQVNTTTSVDQIEPAIAMRGNGDFVISWSSTDQDGDAKGIVLQAFNADGSKDGGEQIANSYTVSDQHFSEIAINDTGNVVVMWEGQGSADTYGIFAQRYSEGNVGTAIWAESGSNFPEYSEWDGTSFGTEGTAYPVGQWRTMQGAESPQRDEKIVIGIDSSGNIEGMLWNGSSWSQISVGGSSIFGTVSQSYWWGMDVQYESQSGDAVMVWNDGANVEYATWDGSSWSAVNTLSAYSGATPRQIQLASNPTSDEMVLVVSDANDRDTAYVWNGSSWGNAITLASDSGDDKTDIFVAYEAQSGHAMVTYSNNSADVKYRTWDGSSWSAEFNVNEPASFSGTDYARWTTLASDPSSDRIALGVLTSGGDVWFNVWDGSAWSTSTAATTTSTGTTELAMAVAFESTSGELLATYGESGSSTVRYMTWSAGSGWSGEQNGPNIGGTPNSMTLSSDPLSDRVMLAVNDDNSNVNYVLWNGSTWGTVTERETNSGETKNQPFLFLWDQDVVNTAPTDLVAISTTDSGVTLNADGGNDVYFVADDGGALLGGLTTVTIEASFAITSPVITYAPILSYADGSNDEELAILLQADGTIRFGANSNGSVLQDTAGIYTQLFDGNVHHVAVSWDSATGAVDFYVDGTLVESFSGYQTGQAITGTGELVFGQDQDSVLGNFNASEVFSGTLYDIRIFDDVRTPGEIGASYDQTLPSTEAGMIANWVFDDLSVNGVVTDTVSGNNLTQQQVVGAGFTTSVAELNLQVFENAANGTVVGNLATLDPDSGDTFTYSLQDNAGGRFAINASNGEITVANGSLLDFETAGSHDITVRTTDAGGLTYDELFTITVTDVNDDPMITSDGGGTTVAINVAENTTAVTTVTATDPDLQTPTFSITGGADQGLFSIDLNSGALTFNVAPDYEGAGDNLYQVEITASDGSGGTDVQIITVRVTDVAEGIRVTPTSVVPLGDETLVNTETTDNQIIGANVSQAIATDANGNYVVVWASNLQDGSGWGVYAQLFNADGTPQAGEIPINTTFTDSQMNPTVAMDDAGNFVVAWQSENQDGSSYGVYTRAFDAAGNPTSTETLVNTETNNYQGSPGIAMAPNGDYVVIWTSSTQDPDGSTGIYGQVFNADGSTNGGEFRVNTYITGYQQVSSVSMDDNGNFVVTWGSQNQDGSNYGVFGQMFDANGLPQGAEFQVNTTTDYAQLYNDVVMLPDGRFVVAYQSVNADTSTDLLIQRFDSDGTPIGGEIKVNAVSDMVEFPIPSITADDSGNFTVVWNNTNDGSGNGVFVRSYDWDGNALTGELQVNTTASGNQLYPDVVAQPGGGFIVVWGGEGVGDTDGVFMQRYGLATDEDGGTTAFELVLESAPTADVVIPISVSDGSEGSVSVGSITFTSGNWNIAQTVTVTGLQDFVADGDQVYTVNIGPATSADPNFNGLDPANLTITNIETNSPPQLTNGSNTSYGEGSGSTPFLTSTLTDINSADFDGGTLTFSIASGGDGTDELRLGIMNGVTVTGNNVYVDGVLVGTKAGGTSGTDYTISFNSNATPTRVQTLFQNLIIVGAGDNPTTGVRNLEVTVTDGDGGTSNTATATANLTTVVNDPPVILVDPSPILYLSGTMDVDPNLTVSDVDDTMLQSAQVWFGDGYLRGQDRLLFTDQLGITGSFDMNSGILTLTGNASVADYQTALRSVQYEDFNPTPAEGILYVNFSVSDGTDTSLVDTRVLEIVDNLPPRAGDNFGTVAEGASVVVDLAANDTDADDSLDLTSIVITSGPVNGSIVVNGDGTVTYTHDGFETVSDTFTYTIKDTDGNVSNEAPVTITVTPVNDAPIATGNTVVALEDVPLVIGVADFNFTDAELDSLASVTITGLNLNGGTLTHTGGTVPVTNGMTITAAQLADLTFTSAFNDSTNSSFTYTVNDADLGITSATMNITVTQADDAGTFGGDVSATTNEDTATVGTVTFADTADGFTTPNFSLNAAASNGVAAIDAAGNWTYTPGSNYNGADSFTVQVTDDDGNVETQVISITVTPIDDAGTFGGDVSATTNEDTATAGTVTFADTADGFTTNNFALNTAATNGVAAIDSDGNWMYTPTANYNGADSFTVQVTDDAGNVETQTINITVSPIDDAGTFGGDVSATTNEDTATAGTVTFADTADGFTTNNFALNTAATNGVAAIDSDGNWTYTPTANYNGADSFTVQVTDDDGNVETQTITITVSPIDDAGTFGGDVSATTNEDTATAGTVTFADTTDGFTTPNFSLNTAATNGVAAIDSDGNWTYTPTANYNGADSFTVQVTDDDGNVETQVVSITVTQIDDAGTFGGDVSATTNEDTATAGTVTFADTADGYTTNNFTLNTAATNGVAAIDSDGNWTYTPTANYNGADSFTVQVTDDDGNVETQVVSITVTQIDDAGTFGGDVSATTNEDTGTSGTVTFADTADGFTTANFSLNTAATNGVAAIDAAGNWTYTPTANYNGADSFTVQVTDDDGNVATQVISISVTPIDDAGTFGGDVTAITNEDAATAGTVTFADTADGYTTNNFTLNTAATNGVAAIDAAGNWTYTPTANYNGADSFTVQVTDDDGNVETQVISITVTQADDTGTFGGNTSATTNEDTATAGTVTFADTADGFTTANFSLNAAASNGVAAIDSDGNWTYTPTANYNGADSFTVQVTDDAGNVETQTINITVSPIDDAGTFGGDVSATTNEDTATAGTVTFADTADGFTTANFSLNAAASNGVAAIDAAGNWTYTPSANYNGADSFVVQVTDDDGNVETQVISITVTPIDDAGTFGGDVSATTNEDTATVGTVTFADTADGFTTPNFSLNAAASNGVAAIDAAGNWTYTPGSNYNGADSFTVQVTDDDGNVETQVISITVTPIDDAGTFGGDVSATTNEDTATAGTVTFADTADGFTTNNFALNTAATNGVAAIDSDGNWTYTPTANYNGADSFTVQVTDDDGNVETQVISITVTPIDDAGTFGGDVSATTVEDTGISGTVTFADTADGFTTPNFSLNTAASNGVAAIDAAGNWTYTPSANFNGADSFTVQVTDDDGNVETQTINITVSLINDEQVLATNTGATVTEGSSGNVVTTAMLQTTDVDNTDSELVYTVDGVPGNGTLFNNGVALGATDTFTQADIDAGLITYDHDGSQTAADSVDFTVDDGAGTTISSTFNWIVTNTNDAPVNTVPGAQTVNEDTVLNITGISVNDVDSNLATTHVSVTNGNLNVSLVGGATISAGANDSNTLTLSGSQTQINAALASLSYQGNSNFHGSDTLTVLSTDSDGTPLSDSDDVAITVTQIDDAGTFGGDVSATTNEDTATSGSVTFADAADGFTAANFSLNTAASNGVAAIDAAGNWTYTPSANYNGADSFVVQVTDDDGNVETQTINVTVSPVDDAGTFGGDVSVTTNEDTATSGSVTFADAADGFTAANFSLNTAASNGVAAIDAAGNWTYTPSANYNGADSFTVQVTDDDGNVETQVISITVTPVDDAGTFGGDVSVTTNEDTATSGSVTFADAADGFTAANFSLNTAASNGVAAIDAAGNWTYTPSANYNGADSFTVQVTDDDGNVATQVISITVTAIGDAAVIAGVDTGSVQEDVAVAAGNIGTSGSLTIADPDAGESSFVAATINGAYGDLVIDSAGNWSYSADNSQISIQALDALESITDTLTVTTFDGTTHNVVITINGSEDAAVSGGTASGSVTEDGSLAVTDALTIVDIDASDNPVNYLDVAAAPGANGYGNFEITGNTWTYTLTNGHAAVQALDVGETLTDSYTFLASDGSSQLVTVTINGAEDAPTLDNAIANQTATEDVAFNFTFAANTFGDVDTSDSLIYSATLADSSPLPAWLNFDAATRIFSGTPANADVGPIDIRITADDGSSSVTDIFTLTVLNVDDAPLIGGVDTGAVTEDVGVLGGIISTTGSLTITDPDAGESSFQPATVSGSYGDLTIDISGNWIYDADNNQAAIQALDAGQSIIDTLTVSAFDGTTHDIVITINGAEDSAVIGGTAVGAVTEDSALVVSDTLMITDVDSNDNPISFNDVAATPGSNGYGSFEMTGNTWTYTLNNSHASVQALDVGETLTDTYTFSASDGSTQVVTVTINGSEDAPVIGGTATGAVSEDGALAASDTLTITDTDSSDNPISFNDVTPTPGVNGYGSFEMSGNTWTYTLNNSHASVQALDVGETLTDLFTFSASDGSTRIVTITIGGAEDAPTLDNAVADQTATEGNVFSFAFAANTFGDLDTSDTLTYSASLSDSSPLPSWLSFDGLTRTFSGTPGATDVGAVDIRVTADDGSSSITDTFTLTIDPANSAPLIGGVDSGQVNEDQSVSGGRIATSGTLTIADPDAGESSFVGSTINGALGVLTIDAAGNWRYSADNGNPEIQALQSGESISETLTVTTADGSRHDIVVTINGAAEASPAPPPPVQPPPVEPPPEDEPPPAEEETTDAGAGQDPIIDEVVRAPQDVTPPPVQEEVDYSGYLQQEEAEADKARYSDQKDKPAVKIMELPQAQAIQQQAIQQQNLSLDELSLQVSDDETLNEKYELELLARIDSMHSGMDGDAAQTSADDVDVQIVMGSTASLTAGIVSWVLRGGSLLASFMSTVPLLNRFDPLPILKSREEKEDVEEDADDDDADTKFKQHQKRIDKLFSAKDNAREQDGYMND